MAELTVGRFLLCSISGSGWERPLLLKLWQVLLPASQLDDLIDTNCIRALTPSAVIGVVVIGPS